MSNTVPLAVFRTRIASSLSKLSGISSTTILEAIEIPNKSGNGDFSVPIPKLRVKEPVKVAKEWESTVFLFFKKKFVKDDLIKEVKAMGPFLNFTISRQHLAKSTITSILKEKANYGLNTDGAGKKVVIEFSSPNIAKPIHIGHLRPTVIGNFLRNIFKANGWETVGINYLGDYGKQYGIS